MTPSRYAEYRRSDYIMPRTRTDAAWRDLERTPRMHSAMEKAVGVLLMGAVGCAILVMIFNVVRVLEAWK